MEAVPKTVTFHEILMLFLQAALNLDRLKSQFTSFTLEQYSICLKKIAPSPTDDSLVCIWSSLCDIRFSTFLYLQRVFKMPYVEVNIDISRWILPDLIPHVPIHQSGLLARVMIQVYKAGLVVFIGRIGGDGANENVIETPYKLQFSFMV